MSKSKKFYKSKRVMGGIATLLTLGSAIFGFSDTQTATIVGMATAVLQTYGGIVADSSIDWSI